MLPRLPPREPVAAGVAGRAEPRGVVRGELRRLSGPGQAIAPAPSAVPTPGCLGGCFPFEVADWPVNSGECLSEESVIYTRIPMQNSSEIPLFGASG